MVHTSRVDLNLFSVFDTIYTEGSVSAAARKLNLTQPALSHALGRLRELFGDPLFERQGYRMLPTARARSLIDPVRSALHGLEVTLSEIDVFDPATSTRKFSLALRGMLESLMLPAMMRGIAGAAPMIDLTATRVARRELSAELASGGIDATVDILLPLSPDVLHARLSSERYVVLIRPGHPALAADAAPTSRAVAASGTSTAARAAASSGTAPRSEATLTLEQYLAAEHVLVSSRPRGLSAEDFELSRLGLTRRVRLRCEQYLAACQIVAGTDLLLTLPVAYAGLVNQSYGNLLLPVPFAMPSWDVYLYWHVSVDGDAANSWLRRQIQLAFPTPS